MADKIIFRDLEVRTVLGSDAWERKKPQPLLITVEIHTSITSAGKTDKVTESVHYGIACKRATSFAESEHKLQSLEAFAEGVAHACLGVTTRALAVHVIVNKPRALLHAEYAGVEIFRTRKELLERVDAENSAGRLAKEDRIIVKTLSLSTVIGVNLWERHYKQVVNFDLVLHSEKPAVLGAAVSDTVPRYRNFRTVVDVVTELVEKSSYRTVEALATAIARTAIKQCKVPKITVRVEKPNALVFAACSAVEITRSVDDFPTAPDSRNTPIGSPTPVRAATPAIDSPSIGGFDAATAASTQASPVLHSAFIALGTNVGDRLANLHKALAYLNADLPMSHVAETSFLYETAPMYVTDQPAFLNAACLVKTELEPLQLLDELQRIEAKMGRDYSMYRNGPRVIDLDILFYDEAVLKTERLTVPHLLLHERRFQLGPLCDIDRDLMHHRLGKTAGALYRHLTTHSDVPNDIVRVTPLKTRSHVGSSDPSGASDGSGCVLRALTPDTQKETVFMGILNCTPDSFSDGGDYDSVDRAVGHVLELIKAGADIIDIGGQSTRPGATQVGTAEEIRRVVPVIQRVREQGVDVPISIDTFSAAVAAAALDAGADIVNDVTGGCFDAGMLPLVAQRQCPYILMHMRGDPSTMTQLNDYSDYGGDVIRGTRFELSQRVRAALDQGVARWNIILDPGIGFAKEGAQNLRLPELTARNIRAVAASDTTHKRAAQLAKSGGGGDAGEGEEGFIDEDLATELVNYPVLVGSSRKRFIGSATGKTDAKDRVWGTAATITAAVQGGASIVRVHDVAEMVDVARVSDHIYRR
ncbi:Dihydropteroate synthase-like protein [Kickxella alabastrina]|uniref:Dihydropteroate synthase-like protein n=1 Tax=Kickxella alabastrina TaxID=61397 RepID=UPI00221EB1A7|nr:Dihydropteroate synthase-like protein [Kickxella alabastrina]KAI7830919.1 Dihydropteroate synthase-like protein [Kickxella alabastrina]